MAVLGLSVNAQSYQVDAMLKAGAFEVLTKDKAVDELYSAIQRAIAAVQPILILQEQPSLSAESAPGVESKEKAADVIPTKEPDI